PLDLDRRAEVLASGAPRLVVVDDLDRGGRAAVEVLPVLAARVAGSATAVVVTAAEALGTGQEIRVGPLGEDDLGALVGEDRPEVRRALWLASGGLPGPGLSLAAELGDPGTVADPVAQLALRAPSRATFLEVDPPLIRLLEAAAGREMEGSLRARVLGRLARALLADPGAGARPP